MIEHSDQKDYSKPYYLYLLVDEQSIISKMLGEANQCW